MSFAEAVKTCFSKYFRFSGRAGRPEYWWFFLFVLVGGLVFSLADSVLFGLDPETGENRQVLAGLFQLATAIPLLAAGWRRMHDAGYPGWYLLLPMLVSMATMFFLLSGVFAFGMMEQATNSPDALRGPAALLGMTGVMIASVVQIMLFLLILWWLIRPSQPGANQYGEPT